MSTVSDFYDFLDEIAPFSAQESWDNSGFLVGDGCRRVEKALVALDVTEPVLDEAARIGAQLIISHHPVIFGLLKEFHPQNIAFLAAERGIAVISSHTSLDVADGGVNDCLAKALGLHNIRKCGDELGLLRIGELEMEKPLSCIEFVEYTANKLNAGGIKYTPTDKRINTVAVCGGSGAEFFRDAMESGADAYVTANIKHNFFIDIRRAGFCVLDAGHFNTENTVVEPLAKRLLERFTDTEVVTAKSCCDPAMYWAK